MFFFCCLRFSVCACLCGFLISCYPLFSFLPSAAAAHLSLFFVSANRFAILAMAAIYANMQKSQFYLHYFLNKNDRWRGLFVLGIVVNFCSFASLPIRGFKFHPLLCVACFASSCFVHLFIFSCGISGNKTVFHFQRLPCAVAPFPPIYPPASPSSCSPSRLLLCLAETVALHVIFHTEENYIIISGSEIIFNTKYLKLNYIM